MLQIENSTLDGSLFRPPIAGIAARRGIWQTDQSTLILRNTTISNFSDNAIDLNDLDGNEFVRISNSILQSDGTACVASGTDLEAADVEIGFSIIQHENNCADFYRFGVQSSVAELEPLTDDEPPRLTVSRRPTGPLSNVVDTGPEIDFIPGGNQFACASEDQLGRPRPIDANLDENPRCDLGAIEQTPPEPFIVNFNIVDRVDDIPGDGDCATVDFGVGPVCTLRAAIMEANALPGLQHIIFQPFNDPVVLTLPDGGGVGGALEITDTVAIDGNLEGGRPATSIEGQMVGERLFTINAPNFNVYLRNLRLTGGMDDGGFGGAIFSGGASDLTIARSELFANRSDDGSGGAIAVGSGSLTVRDSDFENNIAEFDGQAIHGNGGTDIEIANSSFRNHLGTPGSPALPAVSLIGNDELTITNSTFSGNRQGIRAANPARFILFHGTFFENSTGALDIELDANSEFTLVNSIFAASVSTADDCALTQAGVPAGFQVFGVLDSDGSCVSALGTGLTGDPGLLPLTRPLGRISFHHPLQVDAANPSPAIDVGELFVCQLVTDQLGNPRPVDFVEVPDVDGPCDLGSVEAQVFDLLFNDSFES